MTTTDQIHSLMLVSAVSSALESKTSAMDLKGTLTDKINVENFCYNYQRYNLHPTLQFSEEDVRRTYKKVYALKRIQQLQTSADFQVSPSNDLLPTPDLTSAVSVKTQPQTDISSQNHITLEDTLNNSKQTTKGVFSDQMRKFSLKFEDFNKIPTSDYPFIKSIIEQKAKNKLRKFFRRKEREHCLLFMSGHGEARAKFILNSIVKAELSLRDIISLWDESPKNIWKVTDKWGGVHDMKSHLLIIIDACRSGSWTRMLEREITREHNDVSIQSSSNDFERSYDDDRGIGGYFLSNFLCVNGLKDLKYNDRYKEVDKAGKRRDIQHPTFYSKLPGLEQLYRLRVGFNRWEELEWRVAQSLTGTFISANGDVLCGEFKSVQMHGKGEKRLINGRVEKGAFFNDKLEGEGALEWDALRCSGQFKAGQLVELFSAKLSSGKVLSSFDPRAEDSKSSSVVVQDDMVQEVVRCNKTTQNRACFEWIRTLFANSDVSEGMAKNGVKHGLNFHFRPDGGFAVSRWRKGIQEFRYSVTPDGRYEYSFLVTVASRETGAVKGSAAMPEQLVSKGGEDNLYLCTGSVKPFFKLIEPVSWEDFELQSSYTYTYNSMKYQGEWGKQGPEGFGSFTNGGGGSYIGSWKAGLPNGKGVLTTANGEIYDGFWLRGWRHGLGKMQFANGDTYFGDWRFNCVFGRGRYEFANPKIEYKGIMFQAPDVVELQPKNSKGNVTPEANGVHLSAVHGHVKKSLELKAEEPSKFTPESYLQKDLKTWEYKGEVLGKERHGFGRMKTSKGMIFEGEFENDMLLAEKLYYQFPDGSSYDGDALVRWKESYEGATQWTYYGLWEFTMMHGFGTYSEQGKVVYKGEIWKGKYHGYGKLFLQGGDAYEGEFRNGMIDGKGVLRKVNGELFDGQFVAGKPRGSGRLVTAEGAEIEGDFFDDFYQSVYESMQLENGAQYDGQLIYRLVKPGEAVQSDTILNRYVLIGPHGSGYMTFPNGDYFEGEFQFGVPKGTGRYKFANKASYQGIFDGNEYKTDSAQIQFADGSLYTGDAIYQRLEEPEEPWPHDLGNDWRLKEITGKGRYQKPTGEVVEGDVKCGLFYGKVRYKNERGEAIDIIVDVDEIQKQTGKIELKNGVCYSGTAIFRANLSDQKRKQTGSLSKDTTSIKELTGKGRLMWKDGSVYEGEISHGLPHGEGKVSDGMTPFSQKRRFFKGWLVIPERSWILADKSIYSGCILIENYKDWLKGDFEAKLNSTLPENAKLHGKGAIQIQGQSKAQELMFYFGSLVSNVTQNVLSDGAVYSGECLMSLKATGPLDKRILDPSSWEWSMAHGKGELILPDKSKYQGAFLEGQKYGIGTLMFINGLSYNGEFKNDKIEGFGRADGEYGSFIEGFFSEGSYYHGNLTICFQNGSKVIRRNYFDNTERLLIERKGSVKEMTETHMMAQLVDKLATDFPKWQATADQSMRAELLNPLKLTDNIKKVDKMIRNFKAQDKEQQETQRLTDVDLLTYVEATTPTPIEIFEGSKSMLKDLAKVVLPHVGFRDKMNEMKAKFVEKKKSEQEKVNAKEVSVSEPPRMVVRYQGAVNVTALPVGIQAKNDVALNDVQPVNAKEMNAQNAKIDSHKSVKSDAKSTENVTINKSTNSPSVQAQTAKGLSTIAFGDGSTYEGELSNNEPSGSGKLTFSNGDTLIGRFSKGRPHGRASYHNQLSNITISGYFICQNTLTNTYKVTKEDGSLIEVNLPKHN